MYTTKHMPGEAGTEPTSVYIAFACTSLLIRDGRTTGLRLFKV